MLICFVLENPLGAEVVGAEKEIQPETHLEKP
jgi:hypothetical protein